MTTLGRIIALVSLFTFAGCGKTERIEPPPITLTDGECKFSLESNGVLHGAEALSSSQAQTIASLLGGSPFPAPSYLKDLLKDDFDSSAEEEIEPLTPVSTVEPENPPLFQWKPLLDGSYQVELRDHRNWVILRSGKLDEKEWTPKEALDAGEVYSWRVVSGKRVSHWAKFAIPGEAATEEIEAVKRMTPPSHLLLAIAYARCGAVAAAENQLAQLDGDLAARWRSQLKALRAGDATR